MDSTWTPLAMKGVDSEHLDTRRFQIEEICRDLKVFPQMAGYAVRRQDQLAAAALAHSEGHLDGHDAGEALIGSCAINRHRRGNPGSRHPGRPFRRKSYIRGAGHVTIIFPRLRAPCVGGGGEAHGQPPPGAESAAAARARCAQLVEYWDRYSASKGEGGGSMDMPRKSAVSDCAAGRTEAGIRTMEDLLRRNGYAVPPP